MAEFRLYLLDVIQTDNKNFKHGEMINLQIHRNSFGA